MKKILLGMIIGAVLTAGVVYGSEILNKLEITNSEGETRIEMLAEKSSNNEEDRAAIHLYKK